MARHFTSVVSEQALSQEGDQSNAHRMLLDGRVTFTEPGALSSGTADDASLLKLEYRYLDTGSYFNGQNMTIAARPYERSFSLWMATMLAYKHEPYAGYDPGD
ncbi:hypothetical protein ONZ45_g6254 [Pleurotus djamor]|nr:hypothetical protein ONZ45_g6254 [Pleurotus djamor]